MAVLVIAEHNHAALTLRFILWSPLLKDGGGIDIMIAAQEGGKLAEEAAKINGIRRVRFPRLLTLPKNCPKILPLPS